MTNIETATKGDKLIITIDISKATIAGAGPSASGKSRLVASSQGSQVVAMVNGSPLKLGLNVFFK